MFKSNQSKVVKTETRTYTTNDGGVQTTVTETIETTSSGEVRKSVRKVTEAYSASSSTEKTISHQKVTGTPQFEIKQQPKNMTAALAASPTKDSKQKPGNFEEDALKWHNYYREKHGVKPLKLSRKLCSYAQEWADKLGKTNTFQHRTDHKYGENLYMMGTSDHSYQVTGKEAVDSWYSEIKDHTFGREPRSTGTGHFTQVIWKGSSELGIAFAKGSGGRNFVVANYDPAGNMMGDYTANVPAPK